LAAIGARLIVEALAGLGSGTLVGTPQPADGVTYAAKLSKDEGRLDWRLPAPQLERAIRAFSPWPGAWFEYRGERFKVLSAELAGGHGEPGTVLDDRLTVACGAGALSLLRLQRAGKAGMDVGAFLRGYSIPRGTLLVD
jgi:methionyl-tRNA formyltransferase